MMVEGKEGRIQVLSRGATRKLATIPPPGFPTQSIIKLPTQLNIDDSDYFLLALYVF